MGGLAGLLDLNGAPDPDQLGAMLSRLEHRGPDGEGTFAEDGVLLGHRLHTLGASEAVQPLVSERAVLLLDGWVYNTQRLHPGGRANTEHKADSDVLLSAWRTWGVEMANRVEGTFAAAIYDRKSRVLTLMRDRMGVRPLFWTRHGRLFAFASELPALLALPWVSRTLERRHLAEYLSFRVVHAPRTLIRGIHQLEPGSWLRITPNGAVKTQRYWDIRYAPPGTPAPADADLLPRLEKAVARSVRKRLREVDSAGIYLSGGLGSTVIAKAARDEGLDLTSFTLSFTVGAPSEAPFAGRVARLLGLEHREVAATGADLSACFEQGIQALGHPVGNPAAFLQLFLARAAHEEVSVVLSGDGGEELFGGRSLDELARRLQTARNFAKLPFAVRRGVVRAFKNTRTGDLLSAPIDRFGLEQGFGGSRLFHHAEREKLFRDPELVRNGIRREVLAPFYDGLDTDPVNAVLHATLRSWLQEESLVRADRTGASAGVDVRFPLLDPAVVTLAAALPGSAKLRRVGGALHTRWPLRAIASGILPPPLVHRPKRGLPSPLDQWLVGPGRLFLDDSLESLVQSPLRLFSEPALTRLHQELLAGERRVGTRLWTLFILDAWARLFRVS